MSANLCVAIVDPDPIYREGLRHVLSAAGLPVAACCPDADAMASLKDQQWSNERGGQLLLVVDDGRDSAGADCMIRKLRATAPSARIVVLTDASAPGWFKIPESEVVDAILVRPISADALVRSIEQVRRGERILPRVDVASCPGKANGQIIVHHAAPFDRLSAREREVLAALSLGSPNKVIARRYGITEATVKVHVKAILRKIGVQNRTEAALWARRHAVE